jgi:hypothetical protein
MPQLKSSSLQAVLSLCALSIFASAAVPSPAQSTHFYHCYFRVLDTQTMYSSGVVVASSANAGPAADWSKYISYTYPASNGLHTQGACLTIGGPPQAQQNLVIGNWEKSMTGPGSNFKIVHVNYSFGDGAVAGSTPAAAAYSTAGNYGLCTSANISPVYFSDVFLVSLPLSDSNQASVRNTYFAFLKQKYGYKSDASSPTGCAYYGSGPTGKGAGDAMRQKLENQYKAGKRQFVETGWAYSAP